MSVAGLETLTTRGSRPDVGTLLKHWRAVRRTSQLGLASTAGTTPRYLSFVETGRAQPSRTMIVRLAAALELPLRERNELLLAAGYAPVHRQEALSSESLEQLDRALTAMLAQHEPFPAVVMDRAWNLIRANDGAGRLFRALSAPEPLPADANVLRLMIEPGRVRDRVVNWAEVVPALLERAAREAVERLVDGTTATLVAELRAQPDVAAVLERDRPPTMTPVVDVRFDVDGDELAFFSVVSTVGSPLDVTAQELRVESFFPSDPATADIWARFA
ncbi:helix-turn-helix domain-containing protein [Desertimonas flava]|jgi:transcriptional regulator with XRE-family HTH domain|uniref:helix-turn-helix domain-containing protein n=1 Tax=Desertimonas flava TaxID=2064846 RepID=UPI000E34ED45|nr:helix-turn-helix transcriptional regulator [Desertimonas flava]